MMAESWSSGTRREPLQGINWHGKQFFTVTNKYATVGSCVFCAILTKAI
jgi:hypothetical protein